MNKKILIGLMLTGICSSLLVGCTGTTDPLTDVEKGSIKTSILEFSVEGKDNLNELDELIKDNIAYFNQEEKDEIIDAYVLNMFSFVDDLNTKLYTLGYELEDVVEEYEIDVLDSSTYKKIPDTHATIKGFLEEVNAEGFILESEQENADYNISVNIEEVLEKYGKHMSPSLKSYLEFNAYELTSKDFENKEKETIDIDEVADRILKIEKGLELDKKQDYIFADKWTASLEYYYTVFFGLSHDYFISTEYIKNDIVTKYEEVAEKNKGTQLAKDINAVLDILSKNGNRFDAVTKEEVTKVVEGIFTEEIQNAINLKYPEKVLENNPVEEIEESAEIEDNQKELDKTEINEN